MHFVQAILASSLATLAASSPVVDNRSRHPDGMLVADSHDRINLTYFDPSMHNSSMVDKRVQWDICFQSEGKFSNCVQAVAVTAATILAIAALTSQDSDNKDCSTHSGESDGLSYQIHATGSGSCTTTAQESTIAGGLQAYFDANEGQFCNVRCLDQTHGGTYHGYLLIGPTGVDLTQYKCDSSIQFPTDTCTSGGKKDAP